MTELLIASAIGFIVILVVGQTDVTRVLLAEQARGRATQYMEAVYAMNHMLKQLKNADRVVLVERGNNPPAAPYAKVMFRVPTSVTSAGTAGNVNNYTWRQYSHTGPLLNQVLFYDNIPIGGPCPPVTSKIAFGITGLVLRYMDESPAALGGDPIGTHLAPPEDNNMLKIEITTPDPKTPGGYITIRGETRLGSTAYTKLLVGLTGDTVAPNPASCP